MRRTSVLLTMVILIVALMLLAESAQAQREPYYVHPSKSVYYYGNRLKWIIHAYVNLPYGGYLWIENSRYGDIWHWHIRPLPGWHLRILPDLGGQWLRRRSAHRVLAHVLPRERPRLRFLIII